MSRTRVPNVDLYLDYTLDGSIPDFDKCIEIPSEAMECSVNGAVQSGGATGIIHKIIGYQRGNLRPMILATYSALETISTIGKYCHEICNVGIKFSHIGVSTEATGFPASTELHINYK